MKRMKNIILSVVVLLVLLLGGFLSLGKGDQDSYNSGSNSNSQAEAQSVSVEEPEVTEPEATEPEATEPETTEAAEPETTEAVEPETTEPEAAESWVHYYFRNAKLLNQHYDKHGIEMGFASAEEYEEAACAVINNPEALHKTEKEDGDEVYYVEDTNEFVVLSKDGYMRTYFLPSAGIKYYNKQ